MSQVRTVSSNVNNTVVAANAQLAVLKGTVDAVLAGQYLSQKTVAVGTRWDFQRNFALKAQVDHIRHTGDGYFYQVKPGFGNKSVTVLSLAVDTVF